MDTERMLLALSEGKPLDAGDLDALVSLLESVQMEEAAFGMSLDDAYEYLIVLGKTKAKEHRQVLERFLLSEDSLTVALVLEILCLDWDCTEEYLERVVSFGLGVPWDSDEDVRNTAIKILGEYLYRTRKTVEPAVLGRNRRAEVLDLLLSIFRDEEAQQWTRQTAYYALCRASGKEWEELPPECAALDLSEGSDDIDRAVLDYVSQSIPSTSGAG